MSRSGIYFTVSQHSVFIADLLNPKEMRRSKDLSDFDKGQNVTARLLGQSISETVRRVGGSRPAGAGAYWESEERKTTNH